MKAFVYTTLLILVVPLFFYKLGQSSLVSWDEAWYGSIAKNLLANPTPFSLEFNGQMFADHPPVGFWLMAVSAKTFGANEFGMRAASAISGMAALIFVFLLGKELFHEHVGIASALALMPAPWFMLRARSGNLDIFLLLFFVTTIYLAVKSSKDGKFLPILAISTALLFLTKTMVPLTIIPPLIFILWWKVKTKDLLKPFFIFVGIVGIWFVPQFIFFKDYLDKYLGIGIPKSNGTSSLLTNVLLVKTYLHNGIGNWFRPGIAAICLGFFTFKKSFWLLIITIFSFLLPFAFSDRGQIWHLIPVYPFLIMTFFGLVYTYVPKVKSAIIFTICLFIAVPALFKNWYEFIDTPKYISDEAILSSEASGYKERLLIDGDFIPAAAYYSEKFVDKASGKLADDFASSEPFLMITKQWRLDAEGISSSQYRIIKKDRDLLLIRH